MEKHGSGSAKLLTTDEPQTGSLPFGVRGTLGAVTVPVLHVRRVISDAACPLRPGQPCLLCHPDAVSGPQDCPTVAIVMDDDDLRAELSRRRVDFAISQRTPVVP
jgi:hypothetical protein